MKYWAVACFLCFFAIHAIALNQAPFSSQKNSHPNEIDQFLTLKTVYEPAQRPLLFRRLDLTSDVTAKGQSEHYPVRFAVNQVPKPSELALEQLDSLRKTGALVRWQAIAPFQPNTLDSLHWGLVPDVSHRPSVLALAMMTYNAYNPVGGGVNHDWYELEPPWKVNSSFGWHADGIRGHVFGNADNSLLVISIKGTSAGLFTGGPTGEKDKLNDNILFSCCCGHISRGWKSVCDCYDPSTSYQCESSCIEKSILKHEQYYDHALEIFRDVSDQYPNATIWMTGHSLGGALASMVGQTYGIPTVTFESPGDQLASTRLHLPRPPGIGHLPIWHFGHTADPIFIGVCTGPMSSCWYGGFAMETRCHTGKVCVWDTVNDHGWRVDIRSHRVADVIENILKKPDEFPLPQCEVETDCQDCGLWNFVDQRDE